MANPSQAKNAQGLASSAATSPIASTSGVAAQNYNEAWQILSLAFTNYVVTIPSSAGANYVGVQIADMPEGIIIFGASTGRLTFTTTSILANTLNASKVLAWSVGTATASNVSLTSTMANIITTTAATSSATINVANAATVGSNTALATVDGSATAADVYFNIAVATDADIDAAATVALNGIINICYRTAFDV